MKVIQEYVDTIKEELCDAKKYAEKSVYNKAKNDARRQRVYHDLAEDELRHANMIHAFAVEEIEQLERVFKPTQEMQDAWEKCHVEYVEKSAWIKTMLEM